MMYKKIRKTIDWPAGRGGNKSIIKYTMYNSGFDLFGPRNIFSRQSSCYFTAERTRYI